MRAGDPNHHTDEFDLVLVGGKYKLTRLGGPNKGGDEFAVRGNTLHHDNGKLTATIQPSGDLFWHFPGVEDRHKSASRRVH